MWSILIVFSINMLFASTDKLVTEILLYQSDSVFRHTYLYDQQKRVLLDTRSFRNGSEWTNTEQTEWIYFENKPEIQIDRKWKGNEWVDNYIIKQKREGNVLVEEHFSGAATAENLIKTTTKLFENNLLKSLTRRQIVNGNPVLVDSVMYDYVSAKLLTETHYNYKPGGALSAYMFDYKYNEVGNPVSMQEKVYVNDTLWKTISESEWFYKPGTTLVSSERFRKCDTVSGVWENSKCKDIVTMQTGILTRRFIFIGIQWFGKMICAMCINTMSRISFLQSIYRFRFIRNGEIQSISGI
jgi:hypothetical protein